MLITLSGIKRSGKDSCADILVKRYNFHKIALADPLREICSKVFDIPLDTFLNDNTKESPFLYPIQITESDLGHFEAIIENEWGFTIDEMQHNALYEHLGVTFGNPRQMLQYIGTEFIRGCIDDNLFLKLADKRIDRLEGNVVVTDVRFHVEQEWAKNKNALMCLIKRPSLEQKDAHISENQLTDESRFNTIIMNDETFSRFQIEVDSYFSYVMRSR